MQILHQDIWPAFFENFSFHHSEFVQNLAHTFPDLTQMEFKLCCYLRGGYNNRQIAKQTGRSLRTVETIRYRLRKKLQLKKCEKLEFYFLKSEFNN